MTKLVTWVLVADHQQASVYATDGPLADLEPVECLQWTAQLSPVDDSDTWSRMHRVFEPNGDRQREEASRFMGKIFRSVAEAGERGAFDRLVLVSTPRAIGELKAHLPRQLAAKVVGDSAEDLAGTPIASLLGHLARSLDA